MAQEAKALRPSPEKLRPPSNTGDSPAHVSTVLYRRLPSITGGYRILFYQSITIILPRPFVVSHIFFS